MFTLCAGGDRGKLFSLSLLAEAIKWSVLIAVNQKRDNRVGILADKPGFLPLC